MRITEAARHAGTSPRMLRYYEAEGLLAPARRDNGYRDYDAGEVLVARQIVALSHAGFPLSLVLQSYFSFCFMTLQMPKSPSISTMSPLCNSFIICGILTTAGFSNSLARMALWDRREPRSVISPEAISR